MYVANKVTDGVCNVVPAVAPHLLQTREYVSQEISYCFGSGEPVLAMHPHSFKTRFSLTQRHGSQLILHSFLKGASLAILLLLILLNISMLSCNR